MMKGILKWLGNIEKSAILHSNEAINKMTKHKKLFNQMSDLNQYRYMFKNTYPKAIKDGTVETLNNHRQRVMNARMKNENIDPDSFGSKLAQRMLSADGNKGLAAGLLFDGKTGALSKKRIAGLAATPAGISAAYSTVANGSPIRDDKGRFDLPGIPGL